MPHKYATITPLRGGQHYARIPGRETFDVGPYPSLEDALEQIPDALSLIDGQEVEIGVLAPWVADIDASQILADLATAATKAAGQLGRSWSTTLGDVAQQVGGLNRPEVPKWLELNQAINLVLAGWLSRHELHPNFGFVHSVVQFVWDGQALKPRSPADAQKTREAWENDASTGLERAMDALAAKEPETRQCIIHRENAMLAIQERCLLPHGHAGPHSFQSDVPKDIATAIVWTPPPAPEPKWDRCTHTGENLVTMRPLRCCLRAGHSGPHGMEEVPTALRELMEGLEVNRCHSYPEQISNSRGRCELPVDHAGPHQWEVPPNQVLGRFQCRHVHPDGKRCNIFSLPSEDHQEHRFTCGKPTQPSDERSEKCDLDEGHQGPCQAVPF